jgi:acyl carrier protein
MSGAGSEVRGAETAPALCLLPFPGAPDRAALEGARRDGGLPAPVEVLEPAASADATPGLVLLARGEDGAAAVESAAALTAGGAPAPLALLTFGPPPGAAAGLDFAAIDLGPATAIEELAAPLGRELGWMIDRGRRVRAFVDEELLDGQDSEVTATTPLLELGIVDSISVVALVDFVEGDLGIAVPEEAVNPRHLTDVLSIQRLVVRLDAARRARRL